jgi:hypothetical protein
MLSSSACEFAEGVAIAGEKRKNNGKDNSRSRRDDNKRRSKDNRRSLRDDNKKEQTKDSSERRL